METTDSESMYDVWDLNAFSDSINLALQRCPAWESELYPQKRLLFRTAF
jgi:hypothetical protein